MSVDSLKNAGNQAFVGGNFKLALEHFTAAIKAMEVEAKTAHEQNPTASFIHPQAAALYSNRAACYLKADKHLEALHDSDRCIAAKSDWWKGHARKAYALEGLDRYEEAEASLKEALKYDASNEELTTKLRHISAVVAKQQRDKEREGKHPTAASTRKSAVVSSKRGGKHLGLPALFGDWRENSNKEKSVPPPTKNSRKGQKLTIRPTILDVPPSKPNRPMFFPSPPTWPLNPSDFADQFIAGRTDPSGKAPPMQETRFLVNLSAQTYMNQKSADDAYRKSNKIKPACDFCGIALKMDNPPCCECGEPYCSRQCMDLDWADHRKICNTITSQSESLPMFHRMYWEGCLFGLIPWAGDRVKNYSAQYFSLVKQAKKNGGGLKTATTTAAVEETSSAAKKKKRDAKDGDKPPLDENDIEDVDEFTYLMLHERAALIKVCSDLQIALKEATDKDDEKSENDAVEALCSALLEQYLRYSFYDAKHDTAHRCQFKVMMTELLMGALTQFNLANYVEPLETVAARFAPALEGASAKDFAAASALANAQLKAAAGQQ